MEVEPELTADKICVGGGEHEDRQIVFDLPGRRDFDEVVEMRVEKTERSGDAPRLFPERKIDAERFFEIEIRIADFERVRRDVRPVGEQLDISWRPLRVGKRQRDDIIFDRRVDDAGRAADSVELAANPRSKRRVRLRLMGQVIEAGTELKPKRIECDLFKDETRVRLGLDRRKKCFFAQGGEICLLCLISKDTFERAELFVRDLDSPIVAPVFKNGPDFRPFELRVHVIRIANL